MRRSSLLSSFSTTAGSILEPSLPLAAVYGQLTSRCFAEHACRRETFGKPLIEHPVIRAKVRRALPRSPSTAPY